MKSGSNFRRLFSTMAVISYGVRALFLLLGAYWNLRRGSGNFWASYFAITSVYRQVR